MNIRDLKYLVAIADHRHFGLAAEACCVSQPALSMQIKKLEDSLGLQLIERSTKSVLLSSAGQAITVEARDILASVARLKEMAKQLIDPFKGELRLGIIPTLAPYLSPHIIQKLTKQFPLLKLFLLEEKTSQLIKKLKEGKIDAALLGLPLTETSLIQTPLFEEEFLLAVPKGHALSKRKRVHLHDLENREFLLLEEGHCMRDFALELCYRSKAFEHQCFKATSLETLRHMVSSKAGLTLMPKLALQPHDGIHYLPFSEPKPIRKIGLVWREKTAKTVLLEAVVHQIKAQMAKEKAVRLIVSIN